MRPGFFVAALTLLACDAEGALYVDVRTDLLPGVEFDQVRVEGDPPIITPAANGDPYLSGVRVAELEGIEPGPFTANVGLYRGEVEVVGRRLRVVIDGAQAATLVLSRDCRGVTCPGDGSDPTELACLGGRCVSEACTAEALGECGTTACNVDTECPSSDCAFGRCQGGACLLETDESICGAGRGCVPERGCPDGAWTEVDGMAPIGPIASIMAAYHVARETVILYGGGGFTSDTSAAMWEWDGTDLSVLCDPCDPGPRGIGGLVYDEARDRLVLFGGVVDSTTVSNELWEWDGVDWVQIDLPGAPSPRNGFAFVYDRVRAVTVLYGGLRAVGDNLPIDDIVYEYDGAQWRSITPGVDPPSPRAQCAAAYVPGNGVVIYGGFDAGGQRDDMWVWDGSELVELCRECTGLPRESARMAFITSNDTLLLFGGFDADEIPGTWDYDVTAGRFRQLDVAFPPERDSQAVAYDARRDVVVAYGGNGNSCDGNCNDLYEFSPD